MFKKTLKVATVLTLLFGCYAGYVRVFAMVVKNLESTRKGSELAFVRRKSKSKLESIAQAKKAFGPDDWTSDSGADCYITRDFRLYFKNHEQPTDKQYDGKRMILQPVAIIMQADGGKSTITVTAEEGIFDTNQRPGLSGKPVQDKLKPNAAPEPFKILKAKMSRNVMLRHDRGTPNDPADDLFVGPLTSAEFDDAKLQIESESNVLIRDRDMRITGEQFLIQLRPKTEVSAADAPTGTKRGNGFDGVHFAILKKNVHVTSRDVGRTGFLPASGPTKKVSPASKPNSLQPTSLTVAGTGAAGEAPPPPEPKPLDLTCAGSMKIDFPETRGPVRIGPPPPPLPTIIEFTRDVLAQIGKLDEKPDRLACDTLELVLFPAEKPEPLKAPGNSTPQTEEVKSASAENADGEAAGGGTFGNLALRNLKATGHSVWVQLSEQTTTIHGVELKHYKGKAGELDRTYMLGKKGLRGLTIEKVDLIAEGPDQGKIAGVTNVWASDATIYDDGGDTNNATVLLRGPGRLETRMDRNQPAQRIAEWKDILEVLNEPGSDPAAPVKRITLVGVPFVRDVSKPDAPSSLDASKRIMIWLKPKPPEAEGTRPTAVAGSALSPGSSGYDIHKLRAFEDAHLISPGQNIAARKQLDAEFRPAPIKPATNPSVVAVAPPSEPGATPTTVAVSQEGAAEAATPPKPKAPPERKVSADTVWANIQLLTPSGLVSGSTGSVAATPVQASASSAPAPGPEYEVREVRLLRQVVFHQDPEEGKARGSDATGEALYLFNEGENKVRMFLFNDVPTKIVSKEGVAGSGWATPAHLRHSLPLAKISTDDMKITGAIIGMDQTTDFAYVNGPGELRQLVDRGMMADANPVDATAEPAKPGDDASTAEPKPKTLKVQTRAGRPLSEKTELKIEWTENMRFYGRSPNFEKRPDSAARAEFYGHVTAITEEKDSMLDCERKPSNPPTPSMITYTDRPVPLTKMAKARPVRTASTNENRPQADVEPAPEPKADLALIEMFGNAVAVNRKVDPDRPILLQKQRIQTEHLIYDRRTGNFLAPGEGIVYLYDRKGSEPSVPGTVSLNEPRMMGDRLVIPTSMQLDQDGGGGNPTPLDMDQQTQQEDEDVRAEPAQGRNRPRRTPALANARGSLRSTAPRNPAIAKPKLPAANAIPPLILTQIAFTREMQGRFGTSNKSGGADARREALFLGDVEVVRSPVADEIGIVDRKDWSYGPPKEVYFLTSQALRVITEPAAVGSPPNAPARNWMKAWENAYLSTSDKILQADVITYASTSDLFYAYGDDGHQVTITQQVGPGQPGSPSRQKAVQYHPKSGKAESISPQTIRMIDGRTGTRPEFIYAMDPEAKVKKKVKGAIKPRIPPMERKGFSGK